MAAGRGRYAVTRESGVPWLGRVPQHWQVLPGRACLAEKVKEKNLGLREKTVLSLSYGDIVVKPPEKLHGLVPSSFETYQVVDPSDIVVRPTDLQNDRDSLRFGLSRNRGIITTAYMCLRSRSRLTRKYAYLLLHAYDLMKIFYGLGSGLRQNLSWTDFRDLPCCVPTLHEQAAIVRFLEHADHWIQRYIRAKVRLIELLEEQKQAIIHQAVTGQIDVRTGQPYPAYKASGMKWLGKVPEHWGVRRNRWLFRERNETGFGSLAILEVSLHQGVGIRDMEGGQRKQQMVDRNRYKRAKKHDLAYNTMRMWQGAVGVVPVDGLVSPAYVVMAPVERMESHYFGYLFRTEAYKNAVKMFSRGIVSDRDRLYWDGFKRIASFVPPLEEQTAIVDFLDDLAAKTDRLVGATSKLMEWLTEWRESVIFHVVTGKLDVREAAAALSEVDRVDADDTGFETDANAAVGLDTPNPARHPRHP